MNSEFEQQGCVDNSSSYTNDSSKSASYERYYEEDGGCFDCPHEVAFLEFISDGSFEFIVLGSLFEGVVDAAQANENKEEVNDPVGSSTESDTGDA